MEARVALSRSSNYAVSLFVNQNIFTVSWWCTPSGLTMLQSCTCPSKFLIPFVPYIHRCTSCARLFSSYLAGPAFFCVSGSRWVALRIKIELSHHSTSEVTTHMKNHAAQSVAFKRTQPRRSTSSRHLCQIQTIHKGCD